MIGEKLVALFFALLILFILWRVNRNAYLFAPSSVIRRAHANIAFVLHFIFSILIATFVHIILNEWYSIDRKLGNVPFLRILMIVTEFVIAALVIGSCIDAYFSATNKNYKELKKYHL
jgi:hypothetical protein